MEVAGQREFLTLKMGYLESQRDKMQAIVTDYVNKVLQKGKAWLGEAGENAPEMGLTFTEISQLMENTAMFMIRKCEEISSDEQSVEEKTLKQTKIAEEREARFTKLEKQLESMQWDVKKMQDHVGYLETSLNYDKQINTMQKKFESLEAIEQKVNKLESIVQNEDMGKKDAKVQALEQQKLEKLANLEKVTQKVEATTASLSLKVEGHGLSLQALTKAMDEHTHAVKDSRKVTKRLDKTCRELEVKQKMMSRIVADRLAPLEQLREIFNKKIQAREDNVKKLQELREEVSILAPKVHQTVTRGVKQPVGFTAMLAYENKAVQDVTADDYHVILANTEKYFNPETGLFTAPVQGLYGVCVNMWQYGEERIHFKVMKTASRSSTGGGVEYLYDAKTEGKDKAEPCFFVVKMDTGDKLYLYMDVEEKHENLFYSSAFSCFLIG